MERKNEIWKPIPSFEGKFFASNLGRIKSKTGIIQRQFKPRTLKYWFVVIKEPKKKERQYIAHRLIAEAFIPNPENKETVNHKDGNPSNNAPKNLEWATYSENRIHAFKTGLINSTLSADEVIFMRKLFSKGMTPAGIARKFKINYQTAKQAIKGQTWSFLPTFGTYSQMSIFDLPGVTYENKQS